MTDRLDLFYFLPSSLLSLPCSDRQRQRPVWTFRQGWRRVVSMNVPVVFGVLFSYIAAANGGCARGGSCRSREVLRVTAIR
jgi:hypothetical protein